MRKLHSTFTLLLALVAAFSAPAQNAAEDFKQLYKSLSEVEQFYTEIEISVHSNSDAESTTISTAIVKKRGEQYHMQVAGMEMLVTDKSTIALDHQQKQIMYAAKDKKQPAPDLYAGMASIDSLLGTSDSVVYRGTNNGAIQYTVYNSGNDIAIAHLYLDAETRLYKRVVYHYDPIEYPTYNHVELAFNNTTTTPNFSSADFSAKQFIVAKNRTLTPAASYSDYEININDWAHEN